MKTGVKILVIIVLLVGFGHARVSALPTDAPAPTIAAISPTEAYSDQTTVITISGANFVATPTVRLNNAFLANVTFINSNTLTATVPAHLPGGTYTLTVTNPDMQSASLVNAFNVMLTTDGSLGSWQAMNLMNSERFCFPAVAAQGNLYALGDFDDISTEYAIINADGTLGTWRATNPMLYPANCSPAVVVEDYIYVLTSTVQRTVVNPDGTLGEWQEMNTMDTSGLGMAAVVWNGYVYALGGLDSSRVQRAAINSDGTLGTWELLNPMTTPRGFLGVVATAGYLYAFGGLSGIGGNPLSSIERAAINSDGTLGTWEVIGSMSATRFHHAVAMYQGYVYMLGGYTDGWQVSNTGERFVINPDGTLGDWSIVPSMISRRGDFGVATAGKYLYALGGFDQTPTWVTYSSVEPATFLFDNTSPTVQNMTINGVALNTTSTNVLIAIPATDSESGVTEISLSNNGITWGNWQPYAPTVPWTRQMVMA